MGIKEATNHNDGYWIRRFQLAANLPKGSPYCMAGWQFCRDSAMEILGLNQIFYTFPRSGLANSIYNYAVKSGIKSLANVQKYDYLCWRFANGDNGHVARCDSVIGKSRVYTIEFNTSIIGVGGVGKKERWLDHPLSKMKYRGCVGIKNYYTGVK